MKLTFKMFQQMLVKAMLYPYAASVPAHSKYGGKVYVVIMQ